MTSPRAVLAGIEGTAPEGGGGEGPGVVRGSPALEEPGPGAVPLKRGGRSGGTGKRALMCVEVVVPDTSCACQLPCVEARWGKTSPPHSVVISWPYGALVTSIKRQ